MLKLEKEICIFWRIHEMKNNSFIHSFEESYFVFFIEQLNQQSFVMIL
jgi:hypothetical protein